MTVTISQTTGNRMGVGVLAAAFAFLAGSVLFASLKLVPGKYAPRSYESDMPDFGSQLSDGDIWSVLAYSKSTWPDSKRNAQAETAREAARR